MAEAKSLFGEEEAVELTPEQKERDLNRERYRARLAEKLKDPEFRKIEGFPIGTDEAILALSDPPYYTACPNPFIEEWLAENAKPYDPATDEYHREPFAADVSEGKNDPIYNAHSYHTKVPHKAIMRYILHYTEPGDVVFDGFCGTGMTGVAAQMCGNKAQVESLGYTLLPDGTILDEKGKPFSKFGARKAILNDLSPAATFIAYNYNTPVDANAFEREATRMLTELDNECGGMYETAHTDGRKGRINYTVWSEVQSCPVCGGEIVFMQEALNPTTQRVLDEFLCPHCHVNIEKSQPDLLYESHYDASIGQAVKTPRRVPSVVNYSVGDKSFEKKPDSTDVTTLGRLNSLPLPSVVPKNRVPDLQMMKVGRMRPSAITHVHQFYLPRALRALGTLWPKSLDIADARLRRFMLFTVEQTLWGMSLLNRYKPIQYGKIGGSQVNNYMSGIFYISAIIAEASPWYILNGKVKRLTKAFANIGTRSGLSLTTTGSCDVTVLRSACVDYIFTDPPFGENIYYSDLNFLVESWHGVTTNALPEAIIDKAKKKLLVDYQERMTACFARYYHALKPGRWMTVEFHNSANSVWNSIHEGLERVGFVIADIRTLNKQQGSFQQVVSSSAVKQDLVISAYKPRHEFEERFQTVKGQVEGVVEFVRQHLSMLPVALVNNAGRLETIAERIRFLLFDRMVAYHLQHSTRIPVSAAEFYRMLEEQFVERDEMYFLPDQAARYDAVKARGVETEQLSIFVRDEKTSVQWVRSRLTEQPQTLGDLTPKFMQELREWESHEPRPELRDLLREYFIEGAGVWRVPDPNNEKDLEALRRNALLKLFRDYVNAKGPLKVFRKEAVMEGFRHCWDTKQYGIITAICEKIPDKILQEIHEFVQFYDIAKDLAPETSEQMTFSWE